MIEFEAALWPSLLVCVYYVCVCVYWDKPGLGLLVMGKVFRANYTGQVQVLIVCNAISTR